MVNVPAPSSSASYLVRGCLAGPFSNLMLSIAAEETWGQGSANARTCGIGVVRVCVHVQVHLQVHVQVKVQVQTRM